MIFTEASLYAEKVEGSRLPLGLTPILIFPSLVPLGFLSGFIIVGDEQDPQYPPWSTDQVPIALLETLQTSVRFYPQTDPLAFRLHLFTLTP